MTDYKYYSARTAAGTGTFTLIIGVGKRGNAVELPLTKRQTYELLTEAARSLFASQPEGEQP